jgi:hypothetical protein
MSKLIKRNSQYESILECCDSILANNPLEGYLIEFRKALLKQVQPLTINLDDDELLLRFLRVANFEINGAIKSVKKYQTFAEENMEILSTPFSDCEFVYEEDLICVLKERDDQGRKVIVIKARNWTPETVSLELGAMAAWFILDELLMDVETQVNGLAVVIDISEVGIMRAARFATYFTPTLITRLVNFYQGGYPVKIKSIISVSTPRLVNTIYAGFKYLLKNKMRERLHLHSERPKILLNYFNKNILPESLAGSLPEHKAYDEEMMNRLFIKHTQTRL